MELLLIISWVSIGILFTTYVKWKVDGEMTVGNLIVSILLGGISGLIAVIIGTFALMSQSDFFNKRLF